MDPQELIALSIVAVTAGIFVSTRIRRRSRLQGGHACNCSHQGSHTAQPSILYSARKGERPVITVKST
jgi:hypothetical protein